MNDSTFSLRISTPQEEGVMRVSKWLKHQVLLDDIEMRDLFSALDPFLIYIVNEALQLEDSFVPQRNFLEHYNLYVKSLKEGDFPEESGLRRYFSAIFTKTAEILYAMEVGKGKYLIKALKPVVQLQFHHFFVSSVDGKFHPMVLGENSITWGLQFSYPQIYQSPKKQDFIKVVQSTDFPNTALFMQLIKWLRMNTSATPFFFNGKKTNVPMRLGKKCFEWINNHPGLIEKSLKVLSLGASS